MITSNKSSALSRLYKISNGYYNKGLVSAKVRDLDGAVRMLKRSLDINKKNTDARNLLGLVLFEMGEPAAALSEWIISRHFQPKNNSADVYMKMVQSNPTRLDELNQSVKKYNQALAAARQGSDDLAILQLKKVISINPKYIKALLLLSIIYIKQKEYDKAKKQLYNVLKYDKANIKALHYLDAIKELTGEEVLISRQPRNQIRRDSDSKEKSAPQIAATYVDEKPNVMAWVNWFLGIALGIAVTFILVVPTAKKNIQNEYEKEKFDYASELNVKLAEIAERDSQITILESKNADLESKLKLMQTVEYDTTLYDNLFIAIDKYNKISSIPEEERTKEDILDVANAAKNVNPEKFTSKEASLILDEIKNIYYTAAADYTLEDGRDEFTNGNYDAALELLTESYDYNPNNASVLYYLGRVYQAKHENETALSFYQRVIEEYPSSSLAGYAQTRISEIQ